MVLHGGLRCGEMDPEEVLVMPIDIDSASRHSEVYPTAVRGLKQGQALFTLV